mmetsp:Transcript_20754/g.48190  ORF Transcript_20754/g.48190 Transcript_20754/m.48190 type:complete len:553 (+) Transcript_20754:105-1763(+)
MRFLMPGPPQEPEGGGPDQPENPSEATALGGDQEAGYGTLSASDRRGSCAYEDRAEHFYELKPHSSVYSLQVFLLPRANAFYGYWCNYTWMYVFTLTIFNFIIQGFLTACVAAHILQHREEYLTSIIDTEPNGCRDPTSLCTHRPDGTLTCSAPSLRLLGNWSALDVNGDGMWSYDEASNDKYRSEVRCKMGTDVLSLYEHIYEGISATPALQSSLDKNFTEEVGIAKVFFDFYKVEPLLCMYGDEDSCGNLFAAGLFNDAIRFGESDGHGITDFESALDWCRSVLSSCEDILPNTYRVWKAHKDKTCGKKVFKDITYDSPDSKEPRYMLGVDFETRIKYEDALGWKFCLFLGMLLFAFLATMYEEWKSIYRYGLYAWQYPERDEVKEDERHRWGVAIFTTLRFILFLSVLVTGIGFMTSSVKYLELIFDALSLVFIIQVDELLYETLVRVPMKEEHEEQCGKIVLKRKILPIKPVMLVELLSLYAIVLTVIAVVMNYKVSVLHPVTDALTCSCLMSGKECLESQVFGIEFWQQYWEVSAPQLLARLGKVDG